MLKKKEAGKADREELVKNMGLVIVLLLRETVNQDNEIDIQHISPVQVGLVRIYQMYLDSQHFTCFTVGYDDEKVARLTKEAVAKGFNHFKMKVGANPADDLRRGKLIRSIIDDPQYIPQRVVNGMCLSECLASLA